MDPQLEQVTATKSQADVTPRESKNVSPTPVELLDPDFLHRIRFRHRLIGTSMLLGILSAVVLLTFDPVSSPTETDIDVILASARKTGPKIELQVEKPVEETASAPAKILGWAPLGEKVASETQPPTETKSAEIPEEDVNDPYRGAYYVQVFATSSEKTAAKTMEHYRQMGLPVFSVKVQKKSATLWRIRLGHFDKKSDAERAVDQLDEKKIKHLPIQVDKERVKSQPAKDEKPQTPVKKTEVAAPPAKAVTKPAAKPQVAQKVATPVKKAAQPVKKPVVKKAPQSKPVEKKVVVKPKPQPKKVVAPVKKPAAAVDPIAAVVKKEQNARKATSVEDIIARETAKAQR